MTKKIIIGNWKMNPPSIKEAVSLALEIKKGISRTTNEIVLCPPTIFLSDISRSLLKSNIKLGAQDAFYEECGPFTGETAPSMLKSLGVKYVIIGHSERREMREDDRFVNKKVKFLLKKGMRVVVCVGERERDTRGDYLRFIEREIKESLRGVSKENFNNLIVAYEPVWAIGKNNSRCCLPKDIYEISLFIKKVLADISTREIGLRVPIIYGGSVDAKNALEVVENGSVNGLLVGRASLDARKFLEIVQKVL